MSDRVLTRTPEPELMDSPAQVAAYAGADFADSNQQFVDHLSRRFVPRPERGRLIDLGCGPGDICIRLARAMPQWRIEGADAGANMLVNAGRAVANAGLADRVALRLARLPDPALERAAFDCVVSNSLLHHLPDPAILWSAIRDLAAPGAWIQVMDLCRPDSASQAAELVELHAADEPEVLRIDFSNSLHAAWRVGEVRAQLARAGLDLVCRQVSDRHWLVDGRMPG